jgi:hypothetical protein
MNGISNKMCTTHGLSCGWMRVNEKMKELLGFCRRFSLSAGIIFIIFTFFASCNKDGPEEGTVAIYVSNDLSKPNGFKFSTGEVITYEVESETEDFPEMVLTEQISHDGESIGLLLTNPQGKAIFSLTASFGNLADAEAYFTGYDYSSDQDFKIIAAGLEPYQLWTVKTNSGRKAKVLILEKYFPGLLIGVNFRWGYVKN